MVASDEVDVQREEWTGRGTFFVEQGGARVAEMTYSRAAGTRRIVIHHTEVSPALRGRGIAKLLVDEAASWARREKLEISSVCPAARRILEADPQYADVLASERSSPPPSGG